MLIPGCWCSGEDGRIRPVNVSKIIWVLAVTVATTLLLFDVRFPFEFAISQDAEVADPEVEREFEQCYQEKDDEIHKIAFGTIDNPDVQKEFITTNRSRARSECRALHPRQLIIVKEPLRFNLVDVTPRYW